MRAHKTLERRGKYILFHSILQKYKTMFEYETESTRCQRLKLLKHHQAELKRRRKPCIFTCLLGAF
jgi:hypothetical protein